MFCTKERLKARQYTNFLGDHEYKVFSYGCGVHGIVHYTLYLMSDPEGNVSFVFPRADVSRDEVEGNIRLEGKCILFEVPYERCLNEGRVLQ